MIRRNVVLNLPGFFLSCRGKEGSALRFFFPFGWQFRLYWYWDAEYRSFDFSVEIWQQPEPHRPSWRERRLWA